MHYEIIDFHTHPFSDNETNVCHYKCDDLEDFRSYLKGMGVSKVCGSVFCKSHPDSSPWDVVVECNRLALALHEKYEDFYVPGIHVQPDYVQASCEEIERMHAAGVRLIGELVPHMHGWHDYASKGFDEILDTAAQYDMVVSIHSTNDDSMDMMIRRHPKTIFVAAHPNEYPIFLQHLERMKTNDNYYLDISGTGLFRHRMLRYGIDTCGAHRFLFGSDYPACNPGMYIGGVAFDSLLTEEEKLLIFSGNAKRLLHL